MIGFYAFFLERVREMQVCGLFKRRHEMQLDIGCCKISA